MATEQVDDPNYGVTRLGKPLNERPEMRDLGLVLTQYNGIWKDVGLQLQIKEVVLNTVAADNPLNQRECFRETLQKWLRMDIHATWEKLELAITNAKREKECYKKLQCMPPLQQTKQLKAAHDQTDASVPLQPTDQTDAPVPLQPTDQTDAPVLSMQPKDHTSTSVEDPAYLQYLAEAKKNNMFMKVQHIKILLSGSAAAGKSSFGRLLFGSDFSAEYESTEIMESSQGLAVVRPSDEKSVAVNSYTLLKQENKTVWLKRNFKSQLEQLKTFLKRRMFKSESNNLFDTEQSSESPDTFDDAHSSSNMDEQIIDSDELSDTYEIGNTVKMITILDTGGQPEYIMLLPAINSMPTINFVVHDLTKSLEDMVQVRYKRKGRNEAPLCFLNYSYLDMIQILMCFITDSVEPLNEVESVPIKQYIEPKKSYIGFVGTHYDEINKKDEKEKEIILQTINDKLDSITNERNCKSLLLPKKGIVFPVDNTMAGDSKADDAEVQFIRREVEKLAKNMEDMELPVKWMYLELKIQELQDRKYISYEEYERIAKENALIAKEDEIKASLKYFHALGVVLHFKLCNWVIINHQWLFTNLAEIMHLSAEDVHFTKDSLEMFSDNRLLAKELLEEGHIDVEDKGISQTELQNFLKILENLKVITTVTIEQVEYYYLPCALPSTIQYSDNCRFLLSEPLLIRFKSGFLPRGFFCSLVAHLLEKLPERWEHQLGSATTKHYSNVITFCISDENCNEIFLRLHDRTYFLELQVRHFDRDVESSHQSEIIPILQGYMEKVCNQLHFEYDRLEYGFFCHSNNIYSSDDHMVVFNTDEPLPYILKCNRKKDVHKTYIGNSHTIWFIKCCSFTLSKDSDDTTDEPVATNSGRKRKQSKKGGAKRMKKSESTESGKQLQDTIVNSEPEVIDLRQIVVPRVYAHWRDVAFALYYKITTVNGIEAKHKKDPEESCKGLFEDWLSTNNGERAGPKTWATLLGAIEKVKKLAKARKEILKEVAQL